MSRGEFSKCYERSFRLLATLISKTKEGEASFGRVIKALRSLLFHLILFEVAQA